MMIIVAGDVMCIVSIRLLKSLFIVSVCRSLVSSTPACSTTDPTLSSPFRIAGICAETSRARAPGKQLVCTLPSANVARTCRTMESPTITASRSVSRRGAKQFWVEISKSGGGGEGEVVARGLDCVFRCCTQGPWFLGAGVKDIWEDRIPGARGLGRESHGVEVVGVLAVRCILTPDLWASAQDVSSIAFRSLSWACFPSSSPICFSTASSSSCTECSLNVSSPTLKGRHKSAIKASNSETMVHECE